MVQVLTLSESIILLTIHKLQQEAYGVKIRRSIEENTGIEYSYGALYSSLEQLTRKGYADKKDGDPTPERGGRRKSFYTVTSDGIKALEAARELNKTIWKDFSSVRAEGEEA